MQGTNDHTIRTNEQIVDGYPIATENVGRRFQTFERRVFQIVASDVAVQNQQPDAEITVDLGQTNVEPQSTYLSRKYWFYSKQIIDMTISEMTM